MKKHVRRTKEEELGGGRRGGPGGEEEESGQNVPVLLLRDAVTRCWSRPLSPYHPSASRRPAPAALNKPLPSLLHHRFPFRSTSSSVLSSPSLPPSSPSLPRLPPSLVSLPPSSSPSSPSSANLQQHIQHARVRLLDLVEEDDGIRLLPHCLRQLPAGLMPDVARRRPDESRDSMLLHVLAHVDADELLLIVEQL
eukprot:198452-Hanusia_phi.AAC.2